MSEVLANQFLPSFDVQTLQSISIAAPSSVVFAEARKLDFSNSFVTRALFAIRGIPTSALSANGISQIGFKLLREDTGHGFVFGLIGRFWTLGGGIADFDADDFVNFNHPGYAKAVWSFEVRPRGDITDLSTITRVRCLDSESQRRFRRYWLFVRPFSDIIRREALRSVKQRSEILIQST